MANIYVRSSDGSDSDNGSTWALAKATLTGAAAIDAAGDQIYLSSAHAESTAAAITFALAGTAASPTRILSVNDSAEPPTATASGASITTTGNSGISMTGLNTYLEGITFNCGTAANSPTLQAGGATSNGRTLAKACNFYMVATGASARINPCATTGVFTTWESCNARFGAAGQGIRIDASAAFVWSGGALSSGGTSPSTVIAQASSGVVVLVEDVDFTNLSASSNLIAAGNWNARSIFRNCKLPASWSGAVSTGTLLAGERHEMHNCDSADTNYRLLVSDYLGFIRSETTIVRIGGASDGTTPFSWAMISNSLAKFPSLPLASPEFAIWNDTVGSAITVTVEIVTDNVTLNDDECWLEVHHLGTSGFPLGASATDAKANVLASGTAQTSSLQTWTTTGLGTPVKQKLSVTFTPQEKGHLQATVKLAKASVTVYVDPFLTVT